MRWIVLFLVLLVPVVALAVEPGVLVEVNQAIPGYADLIYIGRNNQVMEFELSLGEGNTRLLHPPIVLESDGKKRCVMRFEGVILVFFPTKESQIKFSVR